MSTNTVTTSATLSAELRQDGYSPGAPKHVSKDCLAIDREVCQEATCDECGHFGLNYEPWHRGRSSRAVMHCSHCGHSTEF